ncbi:MAG: hypothetical protein HPY59_03195 [Anaerolineae bacterium]|nr:hypothetical protein [Anaerolineae bacterium]
MSPIPKKPVRYHRFILSIWEERDDDGRRLTWRFGLQDVQMEGRVGFKNLEELMKYLQDWMEAFPP